jgi:2-dehydro-3-deoxyphosphogluconate aldolase / (4S)-4-hydroxy-2-oxoglutarate aldolase
LSSNLITAEMAQYSRIDVALEMRKTGLIPVFYHNDFEVCKNVLKACYDGGIRVFEYTNRGDFAHENFNLLIKYAKQELPGMILGIGSIVDPATAALYIQNGANFIISPILNEEIAKICNRRKILWSPGCGSVSEISKAEELGAEIIKIFPALEVGGPEFVKAVKGPMPWTNIMPTGGVEPTLESLSEWLKAGVWCMGIGSKLFPKATITEGNFDALSKKVADTLAIIAKIRREL